MLAALLGRPQGKTDTSLHIVRKTGKIIPGRSDKFQRRVSVAHVDLEIYRRYTILFPCRGGQALSDQFTA
jgi:hypothetical protein